MRTVGHHGSPNHPREAGGPFTAEEAINSGPSSLPAAAGSPHPRGAVLLVQQEASYPLLEGASWRRRAA